jgi:phage gp29-like protein
MRFKALVHAMRRRAATRPRTGLVVGSEPMSPWREYPADGLTPARLAQILREADDGAPGRALALFEQMEEKDAHLHSVASTRRLALTGLPWQVLSAADLCEGLDRGAADAAADHCRRELARIDGLEATLQHLSLAIGRNIAVAENVWEADARGDLRVAAIIPVSFDRITLDAHGQLRILTRDCPHEGLAPARDKFVVHTPHSACGHAMRGGLLRATALVYLAKHFCLKDWLMYAELFGMPVRLGRYEPSATPEEKRELLDMLRTLGADAAGIFSKAVEVQLLEAGRGTIPAPYEQMCDFFNRELSKAWLGQTLTVEAMASDSRPGAAGPAVHNEVRLDLRQNDIASEGGTIRRDVLAPMTRMRFGPDVPVPYFRRRLDPARDLRQLVDVLNVAVNDLGLRISTPWAHQVLGLPSATGPANDILPGRRART